MGAGRGHYDRGVPEDLVLLHGFSGTHRAWDGVLAHLDGERYRALALDLPGHGEQAQATHPITFDGCVESVLARAPGASRCAATRWAAASRYTSL